MKTLLALLLLMGPFAYGQSTEQIRQEEQEDYFRKWLEEDVKYIISDEERSVFLNLTTPEEKETFIEQFWFRRDPDPRTAANEFKEEHYRRIAYANERFQSGKPGWMTDRGRVYIIHGEPEYIERHPSGGPYQRKTYEGGGSTYTYPFEVWSYRYLEGVGEDIELEFVDPSFSGEYRLALRPEEKDQLLYISGTAPTIMELLGRESGRVDRPFFKPGLENNARYRASHGYRAQDAPFARYARFATIQRAPEITFSDLKQMVTMNITYHDFPFQVRSDFIRLNEAQVLSLITVQVENQELTFENRSGVHQAKANIHGMVRNMVGRPIAEFEDSVVAEYRSRFLEMGKRIKSVYQKIMVLDSGRRYRLDLVVRDENSNRVGVLASSLNAPSYKDAGLTSSSLILSKAIDSAPPDAGVDERFVLGDIKIIPNVGNTFQNGEKLGAYLQVYNAGMDQSSLAPDVRVTYTIRKGSDVLLELVDNDQDTLQYFSAQRLVLIRQIELADLEEGEYQLEVEVEDIVGQKKLRAASGFSVTAG